MIPVFCGAIHIDPFSCRRAMIDIADAYAALPLSSSAKKKY